jgi:hypothetical protein
MRVRRPVGNRKVALTDVERALALITLAAITVALTIGFYALL